MDSGIFRAWNELYTRDLLIINFCSSDSVCLGLNGSPCTRTVSALLIILTFLFKTKACSLSLEFMECCSPKLCFYVGLL